nr:uncharacterized protein LOC110084254 [Pogona vitticeps]
MWTRPGSHYPRVVAFSTSLVHLAGGSAVFVLLGQGLPSRGKAGRAERVPGISWMRLNSLPAPQRCSPLSLKEEAWRTPNLVSSAPNSFGGLRSNDKQLPRQLLRSWEGRGEGGGGAFSASLVRTAPASGSPSCGLAPSRGFSRRTTALLPEPGKQVASLLPRRHFWAGRKGRCASGVTPPSSPTGRRCGQWDSILVFFSRESAQERIAGKLPRGAPACVSDWDPASLSVEGGGAAVVSGRGPRYYEPGLYKSPDAAASQPARPPSLSPRPEPGALLSGQERERERSGGSCRDPRAPRRSRSRVLPRLVPSAPVLRSPALLGRGRKRSAPPLGTRPVWSGCRGQHVGLVRDGTGGREQKRQPRSPPKDNIKPSALSRR